MKVNAKKAEATPSKNAANITFFFKRHVEAASPDIRDYARKH